MAADSGNVDCTSLLRLLAYFGIANEVMTGSDRVGTRRSCERMSASRVQVFSRLFCIFSLFGSKVLITRNL
jgi:hypothetical protein